MMAKKMAATIIQPEPKRCITFFPFLLSLIQKQLSGGLKAVLIGHTYSSVTGGGASVVILGTMR